MMWWWCGHPLPASEAPLLSSPPPPPRDRTKKKDNEEASFLASAAAMKNPARPFYRTCCGPKTTPRAADATLSAERHDAAEAWARACAAGRRSGDPPTHGQEPAASVEANGLRGRQAFPPAQSPPSKRFSACSSSGSPSGTSRGRRRRWQWRCQSSSGSTVCCRTR